MRLRIAVLMLVAACSSKPPRAPRAPTAPHFRVMTYNVNYYRSGREDTVDAIQTAGIDIVCLQEVDQAWAQTINAVMSDKYREIRFRTGGIGGGKAVLSRFPLREIEVIEPTIKGWHHAWLLEADTPAGTVQILHVHLTPPLNANELPTPAAVFESPKTRLEEMKHFYSRVDPARPHIVLGDFNEQVDGSAVQWLERQGLTNTLPLYENSSTWSWFVLSRTLDHVLYSPHLASVNATVLDVGGSDHRPVVAHLQTGGGGR